MIKPERLIRTFLEMARIPGLSKNEDRIAAELVRRLQKLGVKYKFDKPFAGGKVGNLVAYLKGSVSAPPLMLNAHIDTVGPMEHWGFRRTGNWLLSKGKSILGSDDRSGVAVILETLAHLQESQAPCPPLEIVFTVQEEIGLMGSKSLDYKLITARHGIVLDSDSPLQPVIAAPEAYKLVFRVLGKAAHAGVSPETGINAIAIAGKAIAGMKLGRIDFETTANIGVISGGSATNIVPGFAEARGEARSHNNKKLQAQIKHMRNAFKSAVKEAGRAGAEFQGLPRLEEQIIFDYPRMRLPEKSVMVRLLKGAAKALGQELNPKVGGGGSDANIFNAHGIETLILGSGMHQVHTTSERLNLNELFLAAEMLAKAIQLYPAFTRGR